MADKHQVAILDAEARRVAHTLISYGVLTRCQAVALFAGRWGGLLRLGLDVHPGGATLAEAHGPL
jgi:hypothetical protein